jgi:hypothetical protein
LSECRDLPEIPEIPEIPQVGFDPPGMIPEHDERSPRATRVVAVLIALMAIVASWLGYLVADANLEGNRAGGQSRALATELQGMSTRLNGLALGRLDGLLRWQIAEAHVSVLRAAAHASRSDRRSPDTLVAMRGLRAASTDLQVEPTDPAHVYRDDDFPYRLLVDAVATRSAELVSRQDAASESADRWDRTRATYLGALLVVAVGIYLLGFSLTVAGVARIVVVGVGVALGLGGAIWAVTALSPRPVPADEIVTHERFARGHHELLTATTAQGATRAIEHFDAVLEERPTFARAYDLRADARQRRAVLRLGVDVANPSVFPLGDRLAIVGDRRAALDAGLDDPRLLLDLGFHETVAGFERGDEALLAAGLARSRRAARLLEDRTERSSASYLTVNAAVARYNEALALLASAEDEEARQVLAAASALVRRLEAQSADLAMEVVAGALTDLELLAGMRPATRGRVQKLKNLVVAREATSEDARSSSVSGGRAVVSVELVRVAGLTLGKPLSADDALAEVWYRKAAGRWQALPGLSSLRIRLRDLRRDGNTWVHENSFLSECNSPGEYKVELYLNGRLRRTLRARHVAPQLQTPTLRRLRFRLCVPDGWVSYQAVPGAVEGLVDFERVRGAFVFRVPAMPTGPLREQVQEAVERTVATLPLAGAPSRGSTVEPGFIEWLLGVEDDRPGSGSDGSYWTYRDGIVHAQAAAVASGDEVVGVAVFGPRSFVRSPLGRAVLTSVRSAIEWQ